MQKRDKNTRKNKSKNGKINLLKKKHKWQYNVI